MAPANPGAIGPVGPTDPVFAADGAPDIPTDPVSSKIDFILAVDAQNTRLIQPVY